MKPSTLLSLIAFAITAITIAGMRFALGIGGDSAPHLVVNLLLAVASGAAVAAGLWYLGRGMVEGEVDRLRRHIDGMAGETVAAFAPQPWLAAITASVTGTLSQFRKRVDELNARRRELEIQVRVADAERQQVEAILHSISDAVLVTDAFNELALANDAAASALRFPLDNSRHQAIERVIHDSALVKMIKDTREAGSSHQRRHVEHRVGHNGRSMIYDVALAPVANAQQEITGVVTILRDVTKEREIAEMKSDFVSGVSHELRTPLSSIKAYIEMLVDGEAQDEQTRLEFYNIIQSETNRLSRLIDNILNISRIESGIVKVQREEFSLVKLISEAVEIMRPQARAKQISLLEQPSPMYYTIYADKDMVHQALLNLLGNAIKYTPSGGKVFVEASADEASEMATVHVSDTGVGIPPEALPHVFDKFYRVPDHKKLAKGTGLGLNLVKHIVETVHHGKVLVTSTVGKGSRFSITLPLAVTKR